MLAVRVAGRRHSARQRGIKKDLLHTSVPTHGTPAPLGSNSRVEARVMVVGLDVDLGDGVTQGGE